MSNQEQSALALMVEYVRLYLRDYAELNRLTAGMESSNFIVSFAIIDALDWWNATPPLIGNVTVVTHPSKNLLCRMAAVTLLEGVMHLQMRNQMSFSDGGIQVQINDKGPLLSNITQNMRADCEQRMMRLKASLNVEMAMSANGAPSEYTLINGNSLYTLGAVP